MISRCVFWIYQVAFWFVISLPIAIVIYTIAHIFFALVAILNAIIKILNHKPNKNAKAESVSKSSKGLR
jgi:hypothetical protein